MFRIVTAVVSTAFSPCCYWLGFLKSGRAGVRVGKEAMLTNITCISPVFNLSHYCSASRPFQSDLLPLGLHLLSGLPLSFLSPVRGCAVFLWVMSPLPFSVPVTLGLCRAWDVLLCATLASVCGQGPRPPARYCTHSTSTVPDVEQVLDHFLDRF